MKIGFDAKRAFYNKSGLGNYSRNLIKSLSKFYPDNEYHLYTPKIKGAISFIESGKVFTHTPQKKIDKVLNSYWRSVSVLSQLEKDNIAVYHGLSHELPANIGKSKVKSVVTIHDLIFIRYPELYKPVDRKIYNKKFRYAVENADAVVAVSQQTKNDIIEFFGTPENKIRVIYQDCSELFKVTVSPEDKNSIKENLQLPGQYILYVGTIEKRKNLLTIIKALHNGRIDIPLVVIGKQTDYFKEVAAYIHENKIENIYFLKNIPNEALPAIYQSAFLFVYPSVFEGFGIPVLEALNSKIPVITTKGGCFEEVGGENTLYVNPQNIDEMIDILNKLAFDNELRNKMAEEGFKHAQTFSSEIITANMINLYKEILRI